MKILAICPENPQNIFGGMGTHMRHIYKHTKGCEVYLLTKDECEGDYGIKEMFVPRVSTYGFREGDFANFMENTRKFTVEGMRLCLKLGVDVIHAHDWPSVIPALDIREVLQIPVVATFHLFQREIFDVEELTPTATVIQSIASEWMGLKESDRVIVCSEQMRDYAADKFSVGRYMEVIPNGIDLAEWKRGGEVNNEKPRVLFAGRLSKQKGIEEIFRAVELTDKYKFVIAGRLQTPSGEDCPEHPYQKKLKELREKYPERIEAVGHLDGRELKEQFWSADFGLMPSLCEPFGIAALEFMAAGVPLVTTGVGGMRDFVGRANAFICKPKAESIVETLDSATDSMREIKIRNGLQAAKLFSWEVAGLKTVKEYGRALGWEESHSQTQRG